MSNNIIDYLKKLKGERINSFECEYEEKWHRCYGYIRLNIGNKTIDISNIQDKFNLFGESEDVALFKFIINSGKSLKDTYNLIDSFNSKRIELDETIDKINIISEIIRNNSNKEIELDMCIEVITDKHKYLISRENWFDEFIYLNVDKEYEEVYPVEKDKKSWDDEVQIIRKEINL